MNDTFLIHALEGTWVGKGRGEYPTIQPFEYNETMRFIQVNKALLQYEQKTLRLDRESGSSIPSHQETGFLHQLNDKEILITNTQSGGRAEILRGTSERTSRGIRLDLKSSEFLNDARMLSTSRTIEIQGDLLRYEMKMMTTSVSGLFLHLDATLRKVK